MTIKLITLDLDNTLWETDPVIIKAEQACHHWIVENVPQAAECYTPDALRQHKNALITRYPELHHRVSELRIEVLRRVFLQAGFAGNTGSVDRAREKALEAFAVFYQARSEVTLFEGALQALETLSKAYPLMAVTNGNADLKLIGIDHLFTAHFNAEQVGAAKPQPDLFKTAFNKAGVSPQECIHVGDHQQQDMVAAKRLGIKTVWVNLGDAAWTEAECIPDQEINQLAQLVGAITAIANEAACAV